MEIDNSKDSAIHGGKWGKPNSSFYDKLIKEDNYKSLINEAFLIHGDVNKDRKYSSSGCKYPHHSIKNGKLVVNEAGVRAAYNRAKQMGVYHGKVKSHLEEHIKELGIFKDRSNVMKENFEFIESVLNNYYGTKLNEDVLYESKTNVTMKDITDLAEYLHSFKHWYYLDGKVIDDPDEMDMNRYKTLPLDIMDTYKVGVCWDFVNYEANWFKTHGIPFNAYLFVSQQSDDENDIITHTTLMFKFEGKNYWFEESWNGNPQVKEVDSWQDILDAFVDRWGNDKPYQMYQFVADDSLIGISNSEYFKKTTMNEIATNVVPGDENTFVEYAKKHTNPIVLFDIINITPNNAKSYEKAFPSIKEMWDFPNENCNQKVWIDPSNAGIVGCIQVIKFKSKKYQGNENLIRAFEVNKKYRHKGIGTAIMKYAVKHMGGEVLEVLKSNTAAIKLYKKLGFTIYTQDKTTYAMRAPKHFKESAMFESTLFSEKDIYWNKDKFDNGDINLCFITGLSGSGKSTMGSELQKKGVEWYQLDDLLCVKSYFSMTNLKEYGDLIYSFFNGIGKKWYIDDKDLDDKINTEYKGHYEDIMYPEFVHYAMDYAKKYPSKKFVLEGVWLYTSSKSLDGDAKADKHWFRPEEFKKYAFYIKGTSAIISSIRAAKRDSRDGDTKWECFKSLTKNIFSAKRLSNYLNDEKELILFRDYFKALVKNKKNGFDESIEIQDPEIRSQLNWITEYANDEVFREADNNTNDVNGSSDSATDDSHQPESIPKQTDKAEANKNGVNRKKLYIAFIEWCKKYNNKNTFGSHFDKDVFNITYPFVPDEMRYFYRLADPTICVLSGDLTFFQLSELRKVNSVHNNLANQMIFAAAGDDSLRVFNKQDKKVYKATLDEKAKKIILGDPLGNTFDLYIQNMIKEGDFLNAPPEPKEPVTTQNEEGADNNGNNQ